MRIDQLLQLIFFFKATKSLNHFATFEQNDRWHGRDTVLDRKFQVLRDIKLSDFSVRIFRSQLVNDWTQSFARASAL